MAFKIFNQLAPGYLAQHFEKYYPSTDINLRQVGRDPYMFDTKKTDYKKKTIIAGIKVEWNNLPKEIRREQSLAVFKSRLKTLLFRKAFE